MLFRILFSALVLSGPCLLAMGEYISPVFLWGAESPAKSSLKTIKQEDFADIIAPLLKNHMVVAFQEEYLSSPDFLCHKSDASESCYAHLSSIKSKSYYGRVENPTVALRSLTESREYNIVESTGELQAPLECEPGKVTFISFDDETEDSRADVLEAHDTAIASITQNLNGCNVVYLYTSSPNNAKPRKRRATAAQDGGFRFHQGNQFFIFWTNLYYRPTVTDQYSAITIQSMNVQNSSDTSFDVTMPSSSGKTLKFTISLSADGYYTMSKVMYGNDPFYASLLSAPTSFSFHCGNLTINTVPKEEGEPTASLKWDSLQFQAPFNAKASDKFVFNEPWDCVPFFTPGILSGLFVVILLLAIMFTGICWMIDINTMDRFDDPKAKTITINTSE